MWLSHFHWADSRWQQMHGLVTLRKHWGVRRSPALLWLRTIDLQGNEWFHGQSIEVFHSKKQLFTTFPRAFFAKQTAAYRSKSPFLQTLASVASSQRVVSESISVRSSLGPSGTHAVHHHLDLKTCLYKFCMLHVFLDLLASGRTVPNKCGLAWWGRRPISIWPQPWASANMAWFQVMLTRLGWEAP